MDKKKQGLAIYLSLEGNTRKCCADIAVTTLNGDSGVDELIKILKSLYEKDSDQTAFLAYQDFETFQRPTNMSITDYINESERRYNRIKAKEMELSDGVLATKKCLIVCKLLKSANISEQKQTLACATISKLTFDGMKKQIKAIYDQTGDSSQSSFSEPAIKVEPTYHGYNVQEEFETFYNKSQNFIQRGSYRGSRFRA